MSQPIEEARVPLFPEPIDLAALPAHLRNNPIAKLHVQLPAGLEAELVSLASIDDATIEELTRELTASAR